MGYENQGVIDFHLWHSVAKHMDLHNAGEWQIVSINFLLNYR